MTEEVLVPLKCWHDSVPVAGTSVRISSGLAVNGYIINPPTALDQGLPNLNILYIDPTGPAATSETETTIALQSGQLYTIQSFVKNGIWANSNSSGHKFTAVQIIPLSLLEYRELPGVFPPETATSKPLGSVDKPIRSYLYQEYSDDDDLQAFVRAYNEMQQDFVDTFLNLELPVYCRDPISGALLDWVGAGVYGMPRPRITSGDVTILGGYNTLMYNQNQFVYNAYERVYPPEDAEISDDFYRRILTWHYSKGMGKYFSIQWLKKRVMQFLIGVDGKNINIDETYRVSVSFGEGCEVAIRIINGVRTIGCTSQYNDNCFQYNRMGYNELDSTYVAFPPFDFAKNLKNAITSGVLELPFQFKFDVVIG